MIKFNVNDLRLKEKIEERLKLLDVFNLLKIACYVGDDIRVKIETDNGDGRIFAFDIEDETVEIPDSFENLVDYLSLQANIFKEIEKLTKANRVNKFYSFDLNEFASARVAKGDAVFEFSIDYDNARPELYLEAEIGRSHAGISHIHKLITEDWFQYNELTETYHRFLELMEEFQKGDDAMNGIKDYLESFDLPKYLKEFDVKDQFTKIEILSQDDQYYLSADIDDLCNLTFRLTEDLVKSDEIEDDIWRASIIYHAFKTVQSKIDVNFAKCTFPSIESDATFVIFDQCNNEYYIKVNCDDEAESVSLNVSLSGSRQIDEVSKSVQLKYEPSIELHEFDRVAKKLKQMI